MKFSVKVGLAVLVVFSIAGAVIVFSRSGEEGAVKAVIQLGAERARAGDAEGCIALIAKDYSHNGQGYEAACSMVRMYVRAGKWQKLEVESIGVGTEGTSASATVKFTLVPVDMPYPIPVKMTMQFKKTPEGWRVTGYDVEARK